MNRAGNHRQARAATRSTKATRRTRRARRVISAVLAVAVVAMTSAFVQPGNAETIPAASKPLLPLTPVIGVTHAQYSADAFSPSSGAAQDVLRRIGRVQNQHIMGFGVGNPEPRRGVYDWRTLDARMAMIRNTGATTPVITLCCSPDWMKGGWPGRTDWSKLTVAPREEHFDDFAALAAQVARRYPYVTTFQVWNELKGFYNTRTNRWNIEAYTRLYNKVYVALKKVNPRIQVGGPYVVMDSFSSWRATGRKSEVSGKWGTVDQRSLDAIRYWLRHKVGADFLTVDARSGTRDRGLIASDINSIEKFVAIDNWIRRQTKLPIWWSEIYPETRNPWLPSKSPRRAAIAFYALIRVFNSGARSALLWQPQQDNALRSVALWTDARRWYGGKPLPLVDALVWLQNAMAGNRKVTAWWSGSTVFAQDGRTQIALDSRTGRTSAYPLR